jgi:hypothetical protein
VPRVLEAVRPLGYVFAALPMTFDAGTERERNVQRVSKLHDKEHLILDLRIAEAAFAGLLRERIEVDLPEGVLSVVPRDVLLKMKRLAGRPQDLADVEKLEHAMSRELSPMSASRRLALLRVLYVPATEEQARAHLVPEAIRDSSFAQGVARRLAELRALSELTAYLHRALLPWLLPTTRVSGH